MEPAGARPRASSSHRWPIWGARGNNAGMWKKLLRGSEWFNTLAEAGWNIGWALRIFAISGAALIGWAFTETAAFWNAYGMAGVATITLFAFFLVSLALFLLALAAPRLQRLIKQPKNEEGAPKSARPPRRYARPDADRLAEELFALKSFIDGHAEPVLRPISAFASNYAVRVDHSRPKLILELRSYRDHLSALVEGIKERKTTSYFKEELAEIVAGPEYNSFQGTKDALDQFLQVLDVVERHQCDPEVAVAALSLPNERLYLATAGAFAALELVRDRISQRRSELAPSA